MKRDDVIDSVRQAVPECLAAGAVDLATGMLLAVRAEAGRSGDDIDLLAASADDFLGGPRLAQLARAFSDGGATVQEVIVVADAVVFVFQRFRRRPGVALVTVSRASANLGMVLARARQSLTAVESVLLASLAP
jgi:hypothetical protein